MAAKENILERLRANIGERFEMPNIAINAIHYDNVVEKFAETCRTVSGADVVMGTPAEEDERGETSTVHGDIGVAENGCIWIPQREADRSFLFRSEHLNIIVKASDIVSNMHEAYARISESEEYFKDYKYGTFISGPSKTADIEGALVYGAQAARSVTVFIE
ncbi:MAG: LUD domain-containing protein [Prevotella sp.]|nr:LUD domain-containing protein [Candidatus Equicola faecalis]